MTTHSTRLRRLLFSTMLLAVPADAAFAQDAAAIADRLKAALDAQGIELTWNNVSGDASSMVLEGVSIKPAAEGEALQIGNVSLSDIVEDSGGYTIGTLQTEAFSKSEDGMSVDVSPLVITGMSVPAENETDPLASIMLYQGAELASVTVRVADKTAFAMEGLGFEITGPVEGKPLEFTGAAEAFTADLSLIEDAQSKAVIEALGYQNISGYMEVAGSWQPSDGRLTLSQHDISVENVGTLGLTFDFGGYTLEFIQSLQDLQKKMAEAPDGGDNSAQGLAMLGLMQQVTVAGASIRFDDDSLTGKVLEYIGSQQGVSASDIANQTKAVIPFMLAQLNNPELASQITAAINAYLDDPQSIEVAVAPASPVPFAQIMAGAMANPMDLTRTLGVVVSANE